MYSTILQLLLNSLTSGLVLALIAVGFHLAFRTVRVFHLAHAAVFTIGAYVLLSCTEGRSSWVVWAASFALAVVVAAVAAWTMDRLVYRRLSKQGGRSELSLVASMAVYLIATEGLAWWFSNQARLALPPWEQTIHASGWGLTTPQVLQLVVGVLVLFAVHWISRSRGALAYRAVMSEPTVSAVMGINVTATRAKAMLGSGALAGLAGGLTVIDTGTHPHAGLSVTLSAAVAVIMGGTRSISGTIAAALALALLQTLVEWFLNAQWKEGITFLVLVVVLLWRTEGIVSLNLRPDER